VETNQHVIVHQDDKASKAQGIAYVALVISLIAIGLSGWMLYTTKYAEDNTPKTMDQKVDQFFEKQDQEFDKIFDEKEESQ
jgi:hypothetical protein